jgi:DNA helicase HerA-like ATPase
MQDFEKLGVFYLGRRYDLEAGRTLEDLVLYDAKDLVTHAVCVGMTGSGKTGLCLALLEEAAIDAVPALVIDPKGDIANLLLTFPDLRGSDFVPWINEGEARQKGLEPAAYAEQQAETWKRGLADWGQDGERIRRLRAAADFAVYTPGSTAGIPVSVLKSFAAPPEALREDAELFRDRISATATSLLGLLGIDADPVQSREHILLSTVLGGAWKDGKDLTLGELIQLVQQPPVTKIGILDVESFFPAKDRFALAMQLNNLLASPGFEAWLEGAPLDIASLLYTPEGKPRISIVSIAHLSDAERMFVVSMLLSELVAWVRTQPGTSSLRALFYMDEIFGYFPPVANPPSKKPLLTLLKQARAFGLGVVLATQNPVDLDYKGLANTGTWFIGRLQTERDKMRVLEGLEGAAAGTGQKFDRGAMEQTLAGLGNRVFLMNNVHDDAPVAFQVRWTMSYLRGPLTRSQIKQLMEGRKTAAVPHAVAPAARSTPSATADAGERPLLPPGVPQCYLPVHATAPQGAVLVYQPMLLGYAHVFFADSKSKVEVDESLAWLTPLATPVRWHDIEPIDVPETDLDREPAAGAQFGSISGEALKPKSYDAWKKALAERLYRTRRLQIFRSPGLKQFSQAGESERDFRIRLQIAAREERDALTAKLRDKYAPKVSALQERIRKAEQVVARESEQSERSTLDTAITVGTSIFGALFSRRKVSATNLGKAATAAKGATRSMKEAGDVARARETVAALRQQLAELEDRFTLDLQELHSKIDPLTEELQTVELKPKKSDVHVGLVALAWVPYWQHEGQRVAAMLFLGIRH